MKYTELGTTGERVSVCPLGGMKFGTALDRDTVFSLLDTYRERGGNFVDTANMYAFWLSDDPNDNGGASETVLGEWLKDRGARDEMVITTKVGNVTSHRMAKEGPCLKADYMVKECEGSLTRMGIERIDLYFAHVDDRASPLEETMEAFSKLERQGKIRHIGASSWRGWRLEEARHLCESRHLLNFCCVQQKYSYLQTHFGEPGLTSIPYCDHSFQDYCRTHNLTMFGWEPLLAGMYLEGRPLGDCKYDYRLPNNERRRKVLNEVARELGTGPLQVVLAWMLHSDPPVYPVVAADNAEQLNEDLDAIELELDESQMKRLNEAPLLPSD
ncbi:MAG: aldo/keto reductase [Spirochaetota bacterium]